MMKKMCVTKLFVFCLSCWVLVVSVNSQLFPKMFIRKQRPLDVDGGWSDWQKKWSDCYNNTKDVSNFYPPWENFIIKSRNRTCDNPKRLAGGEECELPSHRFRQCSCMNPLGIGNAQTNSTQISSSKYLNAYPPQQLGLLYSSAAGWCSKSKLSYFRKTYVQVEFNQFVTVGAISTVGISNGRITRFKLKYSLNGRVWKNVYQYSDHKNSVFKGNLLPGTVKANRFDSHKVMKYLKVIPTESFGLPCLKMDVYGCVFTCGKLLTSSFGEIVARSSPEIDQNCLWRIEVLNTTSLTFDFNVFYILCKHGYLDFHDGNFPFNEAPLKRRVCLQHNEDEVQPLKLNTNKVWLNFVSNSSLDEVGFNIRYFSECSQIIQLVIGEEVIIQSPNYPNDYFNNLECSWVIYPPHNTTNKVEIHVDDFSIESSRDQTSCIDDSVIIEKHVSGKYENVGEYCNNKKPPTKMEIQTQKLLVKFTSDGYSSDKGFRFTVVSGIKEGISTTSTMTPKKGTINNTNKNGSSFVENKSNNTYVKVEEIKKESDDTWTVIIICVFSAFAVVLFCSIIVMNVRRFLNNRNDIEAQCAKIREGEKIKNKEKLNKSHTKESSNLIIKPVVSPELVKAVSEEEGDEEEENKSLMTDNHNQNTKNQSIEEPDIDSADIIKAHKSNEQLDQTDVDGDSKSFDSSSPQIHSPLRTNVELELDESCV